MPAPEPGENWGIFGGLFDPVHLGHINLALEICHLKHLDGVLLVPAFKPQHRKQQAEASFDHRMKMLSLAVADHSELQVSQIEKDAKLSGYSLDMARALRGAHPGVTFYFLIGSDNLGRLKKWHRWQQLLQEVPLLIGGRPGADIEINHDLPSDRVECLTIKQMDLSSTRVRAAISNDISLPKLSEMVPPTVATYIIEQELYR